MKKTTDYSISVLIIIRDLTVSPNLGAQSFECRQAIIVIGMPVRNDYPPNRLASDSPNLANHAASEGWSFQGIEDHDTLLCDDETGIRHESLVGA